MQPHYPLLATFQPWLPEFAPVVEPEPVVNAPQPTVEPAITEMQADVVCVVENASEAATGGPESLLDILESEPTPAPESTPKVPPYFANAVKRGRRNQRGQK